MDNAAVVLTRTRLTDSGPDASAIARCREGDVDAFAEIVDRYRGMVASVVARAIRDPDDATDVTLEVFVRAYRSLGGFRADSRFSTWLYRIALNTAMRHAGKAAKERQWRVSQGPDMPDIVSTLPSDPDEGPEALTWKRMSHEALREAVHSLPEKQRAAVILHYFEGKTTEEIAGILGVNVGTVWSRLHYAVRRLRERLSEDSV